MDISRNVVYSKTFRFEKMQIDRGQLCNACYALALFGHTVSKFKGIFVDVLAGTALAVVVQNFRGGVA